MPGTADNQGLASLVFLSGDETNSVFVTNNAAAGTGDIDCWIGSVGMPTDTNLPNPELPADGLPHPFNQYMRYHTVPQTSWYQTTITSDITQFVSVQFQESQATVLIVNPVQNPNKTLYTGLGTAASMFQIALPTGGQPQVNTFQFQGNGSQFVWINADSTQDSQEATIALASL